MLLFNDLHSAKGRRFSLIIIFMEFRDGRDYSTWSKDCLSMEYFSWRRRRVGVPRAETTSFNLR